MFVCPEQEELPLRIDPLPQHRDLPGAPAHKVFDVSGHGSEGRESGVIHCTVFYKIISVDHCNTEASASLSVTHLCFRDFTLVEKNNFNSHSCN